MRRTTRWTGRLVRVIGCVAAAVSSAGAAAPAGEKSPAPSTVDKDGPRAAAKGAGTAAPGRPTTRPSERGPALLIAKVYGMVLDTKPAKPLMPRIDAAFEETRRKVAALEREQRRDRAWMKARIEQEVDALVLHVGDMLTGQQLAQLRKAYADQKANIPSAARRREKAAASPPR